MIYARQDSPYFSDVEALRDKVFALEPGFVIVDKLRRDYPEVRIREVKSSLEALLALLSLDLDRFKLLNDRHGDDAGDKMLKAVAERLQGELRDSDTVARIGGDEFVVLLEGLGPTQDSAVSDSGLIAGKLRTASAVEYDLDGIRIYDGKGATPDEVLKDADAAMYQNKRSHSIRRCIARDRAAMACQTGGCPR